MASTATVCVIIAAKDAARTIGRAVASALRDDHVVEVVVVDDGSADRTAEAALGADDASGRLRILRLDINQGPSYARNHAIAHSNAPLIAILDADDFFLAGRFDRLLGEDDWDFVADNVVFVEAGDAEPPEPEVPDFEAEPCFLDAASFIAGNISRRGASRGEIEKLVLYATGQKEIGLEDVRAMSGDVSGLSFDDAVDAMLEGKVGDFDVAFTRHCQSGGAPFLVLSSAMRQLQAMQVMRGQMESGGRNAASVVAGARPPVFFSRRKLVEKALDRWSVEALSRALARLQSAVLQTRRRPDLSVPLARQALLGIAVESARLGQR